MKTRIDVLGSGRERVRTGPWHAERGVAFLAPAADEPALSPHFLARCLEELAGRGFVSVVTAALPPGQREPFVTAGFHEHERLLLLTHNLAYVPPRPRPCVRRARRRDRGRVLAIDAATFADFWRLDELGLQQAVTATPESWYRVAEGTSGEVAGYAITGVDAGEGYMQRLAVAPEHQRSGLGRALALDGLHWLVRKRARRVLVNTQMGNTAAFSLYVSIGFQLETSDLVVFRYDLVSP